MIAMAHAEIIKMIEERQYFIRPSTGEREHKSSVSEINEAGELAEETKKKRKEKRTC
jgi:hypothetical protein